MLQVTARWAQRWQVSNLSPSQVGRSRPLQSPDAHSSRRELPDGTPLAMRPFGAAIEVEPLRLPKLEHLPVYLPESELCRSARGRNLVDLSRDPGSPRGNKLAATERAILSVRERSSFQLREGCFVPDVKPPPLSPSGRAVTRSQLLQLRRDAWKEENARTSYPIEKSTTLPVGRLPGAPGKRPNVSRFTHLDTHRVRFSPVAPADRLHAIHSLVLTQTCAVHIPPCATFRASISGGESPVKTIGADTTPVHSGASASATHAMQQERARDHACAEQASKVARGPRRWHEAPRRAAESVVRVLCKGLCGARVGEGR